MRAEVVYVHAPSDELQKEMIRIASIVLLVKSNDSFYYKPSPMGDISCQLYTTHCNNIVYLICIHYCNCITLDANKVLQLEANIVRLIYFLLFI